MIEQFSRPGSIYAVVSDSYNIYNAVENIWGKELKDQVISSCGTLVIRPDSGDPIVVLPRLFNYIENSFGYTVNDKGYKVLNNVRFLWGDGINERSIKSILRMIVDNLGYSADNIAFGMGGALLQIVNRDDLKFAMKASAACIDGEWRSVFKDPITDPGKKSLAGLVTTIKVDGKLQVGVNVESKVMKCRFVNGQLMNQTTFEEVRALANKSI
jgi:nicotinamide phosphoribosyltransferase